MATTSATMARVLLNMPCDFFNSLAIQSPFLRPWSSSYRSDPHPGARRSRAIDSPHSASGLQSAKQTRGCVRPEGALGLCLAPEMRIVMEKRSPLLAGVAKSNRTFQGQPQPLPNAHQACQVWSKRPRGHRDERLPRDELTGGRTYLSRRPSRGLRWREVFVDTEPAAVGLPSKHDGLAFIHHRLLAPASHPGPHRVRDNGDVAPELHSSVAGPAVEDCEAILLHPLLPERSVVGDRLEPLVCRVEDERRVGMKRAEVVVQAPFPESGDQALDRLADLRLVHSDRGLLSPFTITPARRGPRTSSRARPPRPASSASGTSAHLPSQREASRPAR